MKISKAAVLAGIAVAASMMVLMFFLQRLAFPNGSGPYPQWYAVAHTISDAFGGILPGFVAGWLARSRALVHGFLVAVGSTIAAAIGVLCSFGWVPAELGILALVVGLSAGIVTQSIGALAGATLRTRGAVI